MAKTGSVAQGCTALLSGEWDACPCPVAADQEDPLIKLAWLVNGSPLDLGSGVTPRGSPIFKVWLKDNQVGFRVGPSKMIMNTKWGLR